jgi:hypothetical protein
VYYYRTYDDDGNYGYHKSDLGYSEFVDEMVTDGYIPEEEGEVDEISEEEYYADKRWKDAIAKKKWSLIELYTHEWAGYTRPYTITGEYRLREWQKEQLVKWANGKKYDRDVLDTDGHHPCAFMRRFGTSSEMAYLLRLRSKPRDPPLTRLPPDNSWGRDNSYDHKSTEADWAAGRTADP